ncbi:MAG TPA: VWA domain-containing protein [Vicinamibacterales bacterium]|nr:VWA domain-containing protein [Vicinamibacterales bacterium]
MMSLRLSVAVFLAAALAASLPPAVRAQATQRSMYVSVVNDDGAPVPDLGPSDFVVREDNAAREVLSVRPADEPMQIALLVDTSQGARNNIQFMRSALPDFLTALTNPNESGRRNEVALIAFGERPTVLTEYTSQLPELKKGVNRIWSQQGSGAYFLDAVYETTQAFKKRESTRPVIVALVTEGGELSYRQYEQVLDALHQADAPLYALMFGTPSSSLADEARNRNIVLDRGVNDSGGSREQLLAPSGLGDRLKRLAAQLTHQYRVTYARPESLIPPERITVSVKKAGLVARGTPVKDQQQKGRP